MEDDKLRELETAAQILMVNNYISTLLLSLITSSLCLPPTPLRPSRTRTW